MEKFKTQYDKNDIVKEKNSGEIITEQAGYIPSQIQIENMILAGQRLDNYRKEQFDLNDEDFDEFDVEMDPTRNGNYDLADAFKDQQKVSNSLKKQAADAAAKSEAASKEASGEKLPEAEKQD